MGAWGRSVISLDRFYAAVQAGFYNDSAFFRVVAPNSSGCVLTCGGIVQFGISGSKAMNDNWLHSAIKDDPVTQRNVAGVINFADAGPNTRTTELVFMLGDNLKQDKAGFAPFGKISTAAGTSPPPKGWDICHCTCALPPYLCICHVHCIYVSLPTMSACIRIRSYNCIEGSIRHVQEE